ncbi:MAG: hypothetical protein SGBAC_011436 [Bacillariaceae sp.]
MRIIWPSIKKATPRRTLARASGVFGRVLTPLSVQHPKKKTELKGNANSLFSATPNIKSVQRLLKFTPPPRIIPVTPAERPKVSSTRKLRSRGFKHTQAKRRHRTRILVSASVVFFFYCKSGGQSSISNNGNGVPPPVRTILVKVPRELASPSSTFEKILSSKQEQPKDSSLKRKASNDRVQFGVATSKRLRKEGGRLREGLAKASERLQSVPPYPTVATQTPPNFVEWQKAIAEASERLQSVPPYPTAATQIPPDFIKWKKAFSEASERLHSVQPYPTALTASKLTINLPDSVEDLTKKIPVVASAMQKTVQQLTEKLSVVTVTETFTIIANKLPVAASAMKNNVKKIVDNAPAAAVGQTFKSLAEKLPVAAAGMKPNVMKLTGNRSVAAVEQSFKNLAEKVPVAVVAVKENALQNLTGKLQAARQSAQNLAKKVPVAETKQVIKKWTELPLAAYSHPLIQQKQKQEQRQGQDKTRKNEAFSFKVWEFSDEGRSCDK